MRIRLSSFILSTKQVVKMQKGESEVVFLLIFCVLVGGMSPFTCPCIPIPFSWCLVDFQLFIHVSNVE
jgi:hypothetical protein